MSRGHYHGPKPKLPEIEINYEDDIARNKDYWEQHPNETKYALPSFKNKTGQFDPIGALFKLLSIFRF
jgi:hypothetical protein